MLRETCIAPDRKLGGSTIDPPTPPSECRQARSLITLVFVFVAVVFGTSWGGVYSLSCVAVVTIDPRIPTMPGRSTGGVCDNHDYAGEI